MVKTHLMFNVVYMATRQISACKQQHVFEPLRWGLTENYEPVGMNHMISSV